MSGDDVYIQVPKRILERWWALLLEIAQPDTLYDESQLKMANRVIHDSGESASKLMEEISYAKINSFEPEPPTEQGE